MHSWLQSLPVVELALGIRVQEEQADGALTRLQAMVVRQICA